MRPRHAFRLQFATKLASRFDAEEDVLILIDSDGTTARAAGEMLIADGFQNVYVIQGGADAWRAAELPWKEPVKFR